MDDRDWRAPIALAADAPVAQAEHGRAGPPALPLSPLDHRALGILNVHTVEEVGIHQRARPGISGVADEGGIGVVAIGHDSADWQMVFARKVHVALIVRGNAEHGPCPIVHQHEIGDVDGQLDRRVERVSRRQPGVETELFLRLQFRRSRPAAFAQGDEVGRGRIALSQRLRNRMVGGDGDEARAEDRVGARGEDLDRTAIGQRKAELQPLAATDPVFLHQPDLVGPMFEAAQSFEQFVGEIGDLEEPLRQLAPLDQRARAPAAPVDDLLIGEHGHVDRVPIDRAFLAIDQAVREQVQEQRLFVPVIIRLARRQLARPVEREAQPFELCLHRRDIVAGPAAGVNTLFHRGIFGRHAEGVPPHRVEHFHACHPAIARQHVAHRIVADMAHMDPPRRIRKHFKNIGARFGGIVACGEGAGVVPHLLPCRVRLQRVEA
ncbi:hypothetical protein D9M73_76730 [compost metagenome]